MKLNPDLQIIVSDEVIANTSEEFGLDTNSWSAVQEGIGNVVVRLSTSDGDYYAKYYNLKHSAERVTDEVVLVTHLDDLSVPVAHMLRTANKTSYTSLVKGHLVTMSEGIAGEHPRVYDGPFTTELALAHAAIHNTDLRTASAKPLNIRTDYHFADSNAMKGLHDIDEQAHHYLSAMPPNLPQGLTHLDIVTNNVLVNGGHLSGIIDFEDTAIAPYIFCLAGTLWDIKTRDRNGDLAIERYTNVYQQARQLTTSEKSFLAKMIFIRGWLALHGTLLTAGDSESAQIQGEVLRDMVSA